MKRSRLPIEHAFDARPDLVRAMQTTAPVIVIDVPNGDLVASVSEAARDLLFDEPEHVVKRRPNRREDCTGLFLAIEEPPKLRDKPAERKRALTFLSMALPLVAVSPHAPTHLADVVVKAATARIELPRPDARTVVLAIRIVTGKRCLFAPDDAVVQSLTLDDLSIAVRSDLGTQCWHSIRAPAVRISADREGLKPGRDHDPL